MSTKTVRYQNLAGLPKDRREALLRAFHNTVYADAFGNLDQDDLVLGGILFEYYGNSNTWLATYLSIDKTMRQQGIGRQLVEEMVGVIGRATPGDWILFAEAENPDIIKEEKATARLGILDKLGFRPLDMDYVQPALEPGKQPLDDLLLLCRRPENEATMVSGGRVASFLEEFHASLNQSGSPWLKTMTSKLKASEKIGRRLSEADLLPDC